MFKQILCVFAYVNIYIYIYSYRSILKSGVVPTLRGLLLSVSHLASFGKQFEGFRQ